MRLRAVPKPDDNTVVNSQSSSVHRESQMESASPKNLAIEKAPEVLKFFPMKLELKDRQTPLA